MLLAGVARLLPPLPPLRQRCAEAPGLPPVARRPELAEGHRRGRKLPGNGPAARCCSAVLRRVILGLFIGVLDLVGDRFGDPLLLGSESRAASFGASHRLLHSFAASLGVLAALTPLAVPLSVPALGAVLVVAVGVEVRLIDAHTPRCLGANLLRCRPGAVGVRRRELDPRA